LIEDIIVYLKISDQFKIKNFRDYIIDQKNKKLLFVNIIGSHEMKYYKNTKEQIYKSKIILHLDCINENCIQIFNNWIKTSLWVPNIIDTISINPGDIY
jgi:hypothetical protein